MSEALQKLRLVLFFHSIESGHGPAGVPVGAVNALDPATLDGVSAWISDNSAVALVGSSGVGKSMLLNALAEKPLAATGKIRAHDRKGRHIATLEKWLRK